MKKIIFMTAKVTNMTQKMMTKFQGKYLVVLKITKLKFIVPYARENTQKINVQTRHSVSPIN